MQNSATAKTKWAPKHRRIAVGALVAVAALLLPSLLWWQNQPKGYIVKTVSGARYQVELSNDKEELKKGLGNRDPIPNDHGMLFAFPNVGTHCIWMKDMRFPLDIMWLDQQKQVVHLERDVSQDTYPQAFCPDEHSVYVLELNAGEAGRSDIRLGDVLHF